MTKVLIVDDDLQWQKGLYENSPDFEGMDILGFLTVSDALEYLEGAKPEDYPDLCILDAMVVSKMHFSFSDPTAGLFAAEALNTFFDLHGHTINGYYFKSEDAEYARDAADQFRDDHPDLSVGIVRLEKFSIPATFRILSSPNSPKPIDVPSALKEIFASVTRIPRMDIYDVHAHDLGMLHAVWDDLDEIHGKEDTPAIEFSFGGGRPKTGRVISSMDGFEELSRGDLAVFVCDQIPNGILEHFDRLAAIIVTGENKIPGHIRIILKPYDISLLVGAQGDISGLKEWQHVTVSPQEQKLYLGQLPIVKADNALPKIVDAISDMTQIVVDRAQRSSLRLPKFVVNVSSYADIRNVGLRNIGLTRTEHFFSPFANLDIWEVLRNFLIGQGQSFRDISSRVAPQLLRPFESYGRGDVIRLMDIPAEEFMGAEDLEKFKERYGEGTRGVQLAKQIPDLYKMQLEGLIMAQAIFQGGMPAILIPAVKDASDIDFVMDLARAATGWRDGCTALGAMVETLEACQNIREIAPKVSFLSIGSNDLTAAIHECSRNDPASARLFASLTQHVVDAIKDMVSAAREANPEIEISLCGEAAADIHSLLALKKAGVWIDHFSVSTSFKDSHILPLLYGHLALDEFCGPLKEGQEFYLEPR